MRKQKIKEDGNYIIVPEDFQISGTGYLIERGDRLRVIEEGLKNIFTQMLDDIWGWKISGENVISLPFDFISKGIISQIDDSYEIFGIDSIEDRLEVKKRVLNYFLGADSVRNVKNYDYDTDFFRSIYQVVKSTLEKHLKEPPDFSIQVQQKYRSNRLSFIIHDYDSWVDYFADLMDIDDTNRIDKIYKVQKILSKVSGNIQDITDRENIERGIEKLLK